MAQPSWQALLRDAQAESDPVKLIEKLCNVEEGIFLRSQELNFSSDGRDEEEAIRKALAELLRIRTEKLGWPAIKLEDSSRSL